MVKPNKYKTMGVTAVLVFLFTALMIGKARAGTSEKQMTLPVVAAAEAELEKKWGIKVLGMYQAANGYMLDFRYRVLDPEKAAPLFDRKVKPLLIDQATGAKFAVPEPPKVGALRNTRKPVANKNYFVIFANPANYVKKGNKVTVVIGDFRAENLVVE